MDKIILEGFGSVDQGAIEIAQKMCDHSLEKLAAVYAIKATIVRLVPGTSFELELESIYKGRPFRTESQHKNLFIATHNLFEKFQKLLAGLG